ncbi:MAG: metallophosphoesterase [Chitinophagales bacterium]
MATQNSVHVRWRTNTATNSVVQYGTTDGSLLMTVIDNTLVTDHDITVSGLSADTKYYYSVGATNPLTETYRSGANYFFSTLPEKGAERLTRIWAVGDCGNNSSNQLNVRNNYMKYMGENHTDIMLLLGDNAYDAGLDNEYSTNFFPIYQDSLLRNVVLWPAPGNHDYANNGSRQNDHAIAYYDMFSLPKNGESGGVPSSTEAYYSYDFGNIHFLSLDSYGKDSNTYFLYDTLGPQVRWIKNDLAANTQKWTIAYWHHPPFTLGSHNSETEGDLINIRFRFIRILERYGVDLVLCGHSHVYERSYFLNGYYGSETSFNLATNALTSSTGKYDNSTNSCPYIKNQSTKKGTVYVVSGSAGQLGGSPLNLAWPHNAMVYSNRDIGGGLALTVQGNRLDAEWVCSDGVIRDRFTMMKDVNKKETYFIPQGDIVPLSSSWNGTYNWTVGGSEKDISFTAGSAKTDTVIVTDNNNCLKDSFIIKKSSLSGFQPHKTEDTNIKVTPNPSATGEFNIEYLSAKGKITTIQVFDVQGRLVYKDERMVSPGLMHYNLSLKDVPSGIYMLNIDDDIIRIEK